MRVFKRSKTGPWWADYTDDLGIRRQRSTGCKHKDMAVRRANEWLAEVERIKAGVVTRAETVAARHTDHALTAPLADYETALRAKGTAKHAKETVTRCGRIFNEIGARLPRDLTPNALGRWFDGRREEGMGAATANC